MYRPYDNGQTVADEAAILDDFVQRSRHAYDTLEHQADIAYAEQTRSTLDVFAPQAPKGTVLFIHGGYWQHGAKSDFAFIAPAILRQDYRCVLLEYDLAPHSGIAAITRQIRSALDFLHRQAWADARVDVVGHSAGAHLAACHIDHPLIDHAHLLSGIYDLAPIRQTHLNDALQLSDDDILRHSPAYMPAYTTSPCHIVYGALELPELKWQSVNLFRRRQDVDAHNELSCRQMPGCNHYNILDAYCAQTWAD